MKLYQVQLNMTLYGRDHIYVVARSVCHVEQTIKASKEYSKRTIFSIREHAEEEEILVGEV